MLLLVEENLMKLFPISGLFFSLATLLGLLTTLSILPADQPAAGENPSLLANAVVIDVTPERFPVIVNGGMTSRSVSKVQTPLKARGLALSDGTSTAVLVVVDSCMMPRPFLDEVKTNASRRTGIPTDRILISATHTHSAGSCMGALGTPPDPAYLVLLKERLVETIVEASTSLKPARIGFARTAAPDHTAIRRWIHRPDRIGHDPFGNPTIRANMHSAGNLDTVTGPSGPEDPELSLISVQTSDGQPLAILANFSMHYFSGHQGISADYFGLFCDRLKESVAPDSKFVGIMSHGCSGDVWRRDYANPASWAEAGPIAEYAEELANKAITALNEVTYRSDVDLAMAEQRMTLNYRVPDKQRLEWARRVVEQLGDRLPETRPEIYAREQIFLHERKRTEVVTQALRIGDIAIATTPTETYAITGLKIKAHSPLRNTMVIELANGGDGYIPPPEQHLFGGYNTWAARTAGLEVMAEPKITESCHRLLEEVTGKPRRRPQQDRGVAAKRIVKLDPHAWFRLDEFSGPRAFDSSPRRNDGIYEPYVTYYLEGPGHFNHAGQTNRSAMFVGGRLRAPRFNNSEDWSVSLWVWNGMPAGVREITGWFLSCGNDHGLDADSLHLGLDREARITLLRGSDLRESKRGQSEVERWQWQHVALVCEDKSVQVFLNGREEVSMELPASPSRFLPLFLGGRSDGESNWEGRLDEIALFERALSPVERTQLSGRR